MEAPAIQLQMPPAVAAWVGAIEAAGGRAWLVGGPVRDALRGEPVDDWDLAVELPPDELWAALRAAPGRAAATARERELGAVQMAMADPAGGAESAVAATFTACRGERGVADHRHPEEVTFGVGVAADAARRDFTVNALYADPATGAVVDPTGQGLADLAAGALRMVGEPMLRLDEDALRILRAWRFAHRLGLEPAGDLLEALAARAPLLRCLPAARVYGELTRTFCGPRRGASLRALIDWGLAEHVLPEVLGMDGVEQPPEYHPEGDVLTHVCMVLDRIDPVDPVQAWSAVLHDVGKPATFERAADRIRFSGHDVLSADLAQQALRRLQAPRKVRELVVAICRDHIRIASLPQMRAPKRERWLREPDFPAHLAFHKADCLASHGDLSIHAKAEQWLAELPPLPAPPLVHGRDILALGVPAGPMVGEVLAALGSRLDEQAVEDRDTALGIARDIVRERFKG